MKIRLVIIPICYCIRAQPLRYLRTKLSRPNKSYMSLLYGPPPPFRPFGLCGPILGRRSPSPCAIGSRLRLGVANETAKSQISAREVKLSIKSLPCTKPKIYTVRGASLFGRVGECARTTHASCPQNPRGGRMGFFLTVISALDLLFCGRGSACGTRRRLSIGTLGSRAGHVVYLSIYELCD